MGLSASQARFLQLTARRGDIEYEVQQINFQRLLLSEKMSAASSKYQDAMNNRKLIFSFNSGQGVQSVDISYTNYKNYMNQQLEGLSTTQVPYYLVSSSGNKLVVSSEEERNETIKNHTTKFSPDKIKDAIDKIATYEEYLAQQRTSSEGKEAGSEEIQNENTQTEANANVENNANTQDNVTAQDQNTQTVEAPPKPTQMDEYYANLEEGKDYVLETIDGEELCVVREFSANDFLIVDNLNDTNAFQEALKSGIYYFATRDYNKTEEKYEFNIKGLDTLGAGAVSEVFDKSDDAAAQAEYDLAQSKIQSLDKKLELKLDQLETEREAINTEMDSVKKVIEDNVEQSFNIFS